MIFEGASTGGRNAASAKGMRRLSTTRSSPSTVAQTGFPSRRMRARAIGFHLPSFPPGVISLEPRYVLHHLPIADPTGKALEFRLLQEEIGIDE